MTDHDLDQRYRMADPGYHYDSEPEPYGPPWWLGAALLGIALGVSGLFVWGLYRLVAAAWVWS